MTCSMNTKLTLNIDKDIIEEAKSYAKENNVSLSKLIENYLNSLTNKRDIESKKVTPLVESLTGVIPSLQDDVRDDYRNYLYEKYS